MLVLGGELELVFRRAMRSDRRLLGATCMAGRSKGRHRGPGCDLGATPSPSAVFVAKVRMTSIASSVSPRPLIPEKVNAAEVSELVGQRRSDLAGPPAAWRIQPGRQRNRRACTMCSAHCGDQAGEAGAIISRCRMVIVLPQGHFRDEHMG